MLTFLNPWNRVYKNTAEARQEVTGKQGLLQGFCRLLWHLTYLGQGCLSQHLALHRHAWHSGPRYKSPCMR